MTIYLALLRGINVGGHNVIKMAELKQLFESMDLQNVKTYIQSGNVLFESKAESKELSHQIEQEIKNTFGLSVPVMIRTATEMQQIIKNCPYLAEALLEGESIHISFLADVPSQERIDQLCNVNRGVDEYQIKGREMYLFFRQSIRKSKLAIQLQKIGVPATLRNWKTVAKLASMAEVMSETGGKM
ncbi:DUF1697 domain-containing protein [Metabacillus bambusae]|uniref:DUF1697 domain-containing protein n=1 Tax=Metabacillus bambusae TaxID=2795218 RepID=A0ABS3N6T2_9BACI|nr:DUF1697 domain-containing protein [Metabacillus bambusae]MBO1513744.1 DUF1697 domain-containing protein [Metabacillus bambusae]